MADLDLVDPEKLRERGPKKSQVIVSKVGNIHIFSVFLTERFFDCASPEDLYHGLCGLKVGMEMVGVTSVRVPHTEDGLEKFPIETMRDSIKLVFADSGFMFTLCTGEIKVPPQESRKEIIKEYHTSLVGRHRGITKTFKLIRSRFVWPEMRADIMSFIKTCLSCQKKKLVRIKTLQPMIITDTPADAFDKVALDVVGPLPLTPDGKRYVLTMQDNLTKYCLAVSIPNKRASNVAGALARHFISIFGSPRAILTERGGKFINNLLGNLSIIFRIKHITTSGYHPLTNGSLERSHQVLVDYLKHYIQDYEDWDRLVPFAMMSYNATTYEGTKFSPHELVFGKPIRIPSSFPTVNQLQTYGMYLQELITHISDIRARAIDSLIQAKQLSKERHDMKINEKHFKVGDFVLALEEPKQGKLGPCYDGPFPVVEILDYNNVVILNHEGHRQGKHMDKLKLAYLTEPPDSDFEE